MTAYHTCLYGLSKISAWLAIALSLTTAALVELLPWPDLMPSENLSPGVLGRPEMRDRVVFLSWLIFPAIGACLVFTWCRHEKQTTNKEVRLQSQLTMLVLACLLTAGLMLQLDPSDLRNIESLTLLEFVITSAVAYLLIGFPVHRLTDSALSTTAIGSLLVLYIPAYLQSPSTIRDVGHFPHTSE